MRRIRSWTMSAARSGCVGVTVAVLGLCMSYSGQASERMNREVVVVNTRTVDELPRHTVADVPSVMRVLGPRDATAAAAFVFSGEQDPLRVGVASYDRVDLELTNWPFDEVMFFLEGALEITSASGVKTSIKAGDVIVVPKGFNGTWRQLAPIRKISVIYDGSGFYTKKMSLGSAVP